MHNWRPCTEIEYRNSKMFSQYFIVLSLLYLIRLEGVTKLTYVHGKLTTSNNKKINLETKFFEHIKCILGIIPNIIRLSLPFFLYYSCIFKIVIERCYEIVDRSYVSKLGWTLDPCFHVIKEVVLVT